MNRYERKEFWNKIKYDIKWAWNYGWLGNFIGGAVTILIALTIIAHIFLIAYMAIEKKNGYYAFTILIYLIIPIVIWIYKLIKWIKKCKKSAIETVQREMRINPNVVSAHNEEL